MIISDTREKTNDHILKYFDRHNIKYKVAKLNTGDYMDTDNMNVRVERKKDLSELAHNLLSPDRKRFYNEVRRARSEGITLYILCEHGGGVRNIEDVKKWRPKFGKASGKSLADAIFRLEIAYGVPVFYCDRRSSGRRIVELLTDLSKEP